MMASNPPGQVFPAQVSMILKRNATRQSLPRDYLGAKLFHRREMLARRRRWSDNYSRHAHRGELLDIARLQLLAQPAHGDFQRHRPPGGALMLAQALDRRRDFVVALGDSVPAIAEFRRPLERRLGVAAEYDWRMRFLRGLGHHLEAFNRDRLAVILGQIFGPHLLHQGDIFARPQRAVLEIHTDAFKLFFEPADTDAEDESTARKHVETRDRLRRRDRVANR